MDGSLLETLSSGFLMHTLVELLVSNSVGCFFVSEVDEDEEDDDGALMMVVVVAAVLGELSDVDSVCVEDVSVVVVAIFLTLSL